MASRNLPAALISEVAIKMGAIRATPGNRSIAEASLTVKSLGVLVIRLAGLKPRVSERPGNTMTKLLPMAENSPTT